MMNNTTIDNISSYMKKYIIMKDIFKLLSENDISYAHIKGEALSLQAYGKCGCRQYNDIDILISRKDMSKTRILLSESGFNDHQKTLPKEIQIFIKSTSHQLLPFSNKNKIIPLYVDLNFDIYWGEYNGSRVDISDFLSDTTEVNIYGCIIKTLPPLKTFVQLALHHYKDLNSIFILATQSRIKQSMFQDIYYLLINNPETISLENLYKFSVEHKIVPYVYYILYYTGLIYQNKVINDYISAFKTLEGESLIDCYGLNESERRKWKVDFNARLASKNVFDLIKDDLLEKDIEKIAINKEVFLGDYYG